MPACDPGDTPGDRTAYSSTVQHRPRGAVAQVVEPNRAQQFPEVALPRGGSVASG